MAQPTSLIVCPTSHMDWDWQYSFEKYYKSGPGSENTAPVQNILSSAADLFSTQPGFLFDLAEIAWLQRYLVDQGGVLPKVPLADKLYLLGGGITSPDNLVCDGEVFVRNYLVGRRWARSVGLENNIQNICWVPDDFGHDPELPVIVSAMGLTAIGFARVPGAFPNYNSPINNAGPSMACSLMAQGLAFVWQASDGSSVFAHFMPDTYGVPFYSEGIEYNANSWKEFVQSDYLSSYPCSSEQVVWPGNIAFAPAGGDFAPPNSYWVDGKVRFNDMRIGTTASIGTFQDYVTAVLDSGATLVKTQLDPSNFWTGYFGSHPALKTLQAHASRDLRAAESASSLLRFGGTISGAALDALDGAIWQAWTMLAPSSHHDYIPGTSCDSIYKAEQLPMLSLVSRVASDIYGQSVRTIADAIQPSPSGTVVAVHNSVGVERSGLFELKGASAVEFANGPALVQSLPDGGLLVQSPTVPSLGYVSGTVTLGTPAAAPPPQSVSTYLTMDNGTIEIGVHRDQLWAITWLGPTGGANVLKGGDANLIRLYNDSGNLYQYGNEPGAGGRFSGLYELRSGGDAVQTEFGPLRWRAECILNYPSQPDVEYKVVYTLIVGEPMVHISVTGKAPGNPDSYTVVAEFPAIATDGVTPGTHLVYGTAHHYHDDQAPAYWAGPTFKATHNFLMPAADTPGKTFSIAAIYHDGMPAWACDDGKLLGSLFRNTNGTQRGAHGTDHDVHTQEYVLRISPTALDPKTGTPLIESLSAMTPLRAELSSPTNQPQSPITIAASGSLASTPSPSVIRVSRPMGEVASTTGDYLAKVAVRIYRPDADGQADSVQVTMPVLQSVNSASAQLITALEDPIANSTTLPVNAGVVTVPVSAAVTTIAVTANRPPIGESGC